MLKLSFKTEKFDLKNCKVTVYAECQCDQEQEVVQMIQIIFAIYVVVEDSLKTYAMHTLE